MKEYIVIGVAIACILIASFSVFFIREIEVSKLKNMIDQKESKNGEYLEHIDELNNEINQLKEVPILRGVWQRVTPVIGWDEINTTIHLQYPKTIIINNDSTAILIFDYGQVETYYSSIWNYGGIIFLDKDGIQVRSYTIHLSDQETNVSYYRKITIDTRIADFPTILYGQNEDYYTI
jgi:hypothetical protein